MEVLRVTPNLPNCALIAESCADPSQEDLKQHSLAVCYLILAIKRLSANEQRDYVIEGGHLCLVCD